MGMVPPQGIGAPVPPWDLQGQLKGALTRTRYRTVWRQLPRRESAGRSLED